MAGLTNIWLGTTDGDWDVTTNWSQGALPGDQDDVIFPPDDVVTNAPDTNLDRTGDNSSAGLDLDSVTVSRGASYDIGSTGTRLQLTVEEHFTHLGSGSVYFKSDTGTAGDTSGRIIVDTPNRSGGFFFTGDTNVARLDVLAGFCDLNLASTTLTDLYVVRSVLAVNPRVDISSTTLIDNMHMASGHVVSNHASSADDQLYMFGGTWEQKTAMAAVGGNENEIHLVGGYLNYRGKNPAAGNGPKIYAMGGILDTRDPGGSDVVRIHELDLYAACDFRRGTRVSIGTETHYNEE